MWFVFAMFTYINSAHFALANRLSDFRIQSTKKQSTRCDRCSIEIIIIITIRFVSCWAYIMFGVERGVECSVMCIISNSIRVGDWWLWIKALFPSSTIVIRLPKIDWQNTIYRIVCFDRKAFQDELIAIQTAYESIFEHYRRSRRYLLSDIWWMTWQKWRIQQFWGWTKLLKHICVHICVETWYNSVYLNTIYP